MSRTVGRWLAVASAAMMLVAACAPASGSVSTSAGSSSTGQATGSASAGGQSAPAGKNSVVIRAISSWEKNISYAQPLNMFIERVKQKSNGAVEIQFFGPEVVPALEALTAVSRGTYDMVHTSPSFYGTNVPEGNALQFALEPCQKYREAGALDVFEQVHREKANVMLLSCSGGGHGFVFLTKDPVESLDYFKGKKFRSLPLYAPILTALGASTVQIPPAELYTALERKVVDGAAWPELGIEERKLQEVVKYMITPTWLNVRETFLYNVDAYNRLPADVQKLLKDTAVEMESEFDAFFTDVARKEQQSLQAQGVQIQKLPPAEAERLLKLVEESVWGSIINDSPQWGPKLREAFAKVKTS